MFGDVSIQKIYSNILDYNVTWPESDNEEECVPFELKDFIMRLTDKEPQKRLGANGFHEILSHPFLLTANINKAFLQPAPYNNFKFEQEPF